MNFSQPLIKEQQSPVFEDSQKSNSADAKNGYGLFDANLLDLPIGQASKHTNATETSVRQQ